MYKSISNALAAKTKASTFLKQKLTLGHDSQPLLSIFSHPLVHYKKPIQF
jgi:hypothetical protein